MWYATSLLFERIRVAGGSDELLWEAAVGNDPDKPGHEPRVRRILKTFCANLTNKEKNLIRKRAKSVYKRGYFWVMVNGRVIKNISRAAGPFSALASYTENFSDVRACEYDPELEACPDE